MLAVMCERFGGPDDLVLREVPPPPAPGPSEVHVRLKARGVSFTDLLVIAGKYQVRRDPPFVVGGEGAGEVIAMGADVRDIALGDLVLCRGGCIEEVVVPASSVTRLPGTANPVAAAGFRSNYATALYALEAARLTAGETLLVTGAAGGVGLAAVDLGKLFGARVLAAARGQDKLVTCEQMGADAVIDYTYGFAEQVQNLTGGRGADVVYDPVGGDVFDESMECVAPFGRIVVVGFAAGRPALADTGAMRDKDVSVLGFTLGGVAQHAPALARRHAEMLLNWLGSGRINPYVSHEVPLRDTVAALKLVVERKVVGKAMIVG